MVPKPSLTHVRTHIHAHACARALADKHSVDRRSQNHPWGGGYINLIAQASLESTTACRERGEQKAAERHDEAKRVIVAT